MLYMVRKETNFRDKVNTPQIGNKILLGKKTFIPMRK